MVDDKRPIDERLYEALTQNGPGTIDVVLDRVRLTDALPISHATIRIPFVSQAAVESHTEAAIDAAIAEAKLDPPIKRAFPITYEQAESLLNLIGCVIGGDYAPRHGAQVRMEHLAAVGDELLKTPHPEFSRRPFPGLTHRDHEFGSTAPRKRVWRRDWPGDTFEVLSSDEFETLQRMCVRFSIPLVQASDDD